MLLKVDDFGLNSVTIIRLMIGAYDDLTANTARKLSASFFFKSMV
jgi:hypothetical protein